MEISKALKQYLYFRSLLARVWALPITITEQAEEAYIQGKITEQQWARIRSAVCHR